MQAVARSSALRDAVKKAGKGGAALMGSPERGQPCSVGPCASMGATVLFLMLICLSRDRAPICCISAQMAPMAGSTLQVGESIQVFNVGGKAPVP